MVVGEAVGGDPSSFTCSTTGLREGIGFSPFITHPRAKNESPASIAEPQAEEYHLLYIRLAYLNCSRSVAESGLIASGGLGYLLLFFKGGNPFSGGFFGDAIVKQ